MATLRLLVLLAVRSLYHHKLKTAVVGSILFVGTVVLVVGGTLLGNMERAISESMIGSMTGHLQVYSNTARDPLSLFGSMVTLASEDVDTIPRFSDVRRALIEVPNVKAIVPMGGWVGSVSKPSSVDRALAELRGAVQKGDDPSRIVRLSTRVRRLLELQKKELAARAAISSDTAALERSLADIDRALSDAFQKELEARPLEALEFLDTRIAPLSSGATTVYLRFTGTDVDQFAKNFERFRIVQGQQIPPGKRGFLFNRSFYEDHFKNAVARDLDWIDAAIHEKELRVEEDESLKARIAQLPSQLESVMRELDSSSAEKIDARLRALLPGVSGDLTDRMRAFLTVDATNVTARRKFFYEEIAPMIPLYDASVGDVLTLQALTKNGYTAAVNLRVYGIFDFKGLEGAELAGNQNLTDLATFRQLYGAMTPEQLREQEALKANVGLEDLSEQDAERELFGAGKSIEAAAKQDVHFDEFAGVDLKQDVQHSRELQEAEFDPATIDDGLALNAAIILREPQLIRRTAIALAKAADDRALGLKVIDWQAASGLYGQFVVVLRGVLAGIFIIILVVSMVIINNAVVTATIGRVTEIGTMRAMGAQRPFVISMVFFETLMLALGAASLGALTAAGIIAKLGSTGIPARTEARMFMFGGTRLFPVLEADAVAFGMLAIAVVAIISSLYPAFVANRVPPAVAMQVKE